MKYLEGAATLVSEVCRILRRRASKLRTDGTVPAVVGLAHARWSAERLMPARIGQSISHLAGGIDDLQDIQDAIYRT